MWGQLNSYETEQCPFLEISFPSGTLLIAGYHFTAREERWQGGCAGAQSGLEMGHGCSRVSSLPAFQAVIEKGRPHLAQQGFCLHLLLAIEQCQA